MPPRIDIAAVLARVQVQDACTWQPEDGSAPATPLALRRHVRDHGRRLLLGGNPLSVEVTTSPLPLALLAALLQHEDALRTLVEWDEQRAGIGAYCGDGFLMRMPSGWPKPLPPAQGLVTRRSGMWRKERHIIPFDRRHKD